MSHYQGDKLLRLPSHSYDTKDLVRNMSVNADGPEEIIEADEYLQPQLMGATADLRLNRHPHTANGKLDKVGVGLMTGKYVDFVDG